jgi:hypothetical protein
MTRFAMLISAIIVLPLLAQHEAQSAPSVPVDAVAIVGAASEDALSAFARRVGGARTANVSRGHSVNRSMNVNRSVNVNRNLNVNRNVNRNLNVNRNVGVNRAVVGGVGRVAVVRPIRPWVRRPYYGTVVAGVALGTIIVASTIPPAPSSDVCWYWSNSSRTRGYWDYCQ